MFPKTRTQLSPKDFFLLLKLNMVEGKGNNPEIAHLNR